MGQGRRPSEYGLWPHRPRRAGTLRLETHTKNKPLPGPRPVSTEPDGPHARSARADGRVRPVRERLRTGAAHEPDGPTGRVAFPKRMSERGAFVHHPRGDPLRPRRAPERRPRLPVPHGLASPAGLVTARQARSSPAGRRMYVPVDPWLPSRNTRGIFALRCGECRSRSPDPSP